MGVLLQGMEKIGDKVFMYKDPCNSQTEWLASAPGDSDQQIPGLTGQPAYQKEQTTYSLRGCITKNKVVKKRKMHPMLVDLCPPGDTGEYTHGHAHTCTHMCTYDYP